MVLSLHGSRLKLQSSDSNYSSLHASRCRSAHDLLSDSKIISSISCRLVKKHGFVPRKQLAKNIKWRLNAVNLIPAGFKAMKARSNLVALQSIWLCIEYEQLDESGINIDVSEAKNPESHLWQNSNYILPHIVVPVQRRSCGKQVIMLSVKHKCKRLDWELH